MAKLRFSAPVTHVYNPLGYAWPAHRQYLERYGSGPGGRVLIHIIHRLLQAAVSALNRAARDFTLVLAFGPELRAVAAGKLVYKPEPGVMPGLFVLCSGITQPGNELYGCHTD